MAYFDMILSVPFWFDLTPLRFQNPFWLPRPLPLPFLCYLATLHSAHLCAHKHNLPMVPVAGSFLLQHLWVPYFLIFNNCSSSFSYRHSEIQLHPSSVACNQDSCSRKLFKEMASFCLRWIKWKTKCLLHFGFIVILSWRSFCCNGTNKIHFNLSGLAPTLL